MNSVTSGPADRVSAFATITLNVRKVAPMASSISFLSNATAQDIVEAAYASRRLTVTANPSFLRHVAEDIRLGDRSGTARSLADRLSERAPVSCYGVRDRQPFQAQIRPSEIPDAVAAGHSIVVENVRDASPTLARAGDELRDVVGFAPAGSSVHFSLSSRGDAVPTHFDGAEVLMIQLAGSKTFHVGRAVEIDFPERSMFHASQTSGARDGDRRMPGWFPSSYPSGERLEPVNLSAGQGIFLSRGWWHRTATSQEYSVNVIFSMPSPTFAKLAVMQLAERLISDAELRAPVIGLWSTEPDIRDSARARVQGNWTHAVRRAAGLMSTLQTYDEKSPDGL